MNWLTNAIRTWLKIDEISGKPCRWCGQRIGLNPRYAPIPLCGTCYSDAYKYNRVEGHPMFDKWNQSMVEFEQEWKVYVWRCMHRAAGDVESASAEATIDVEEDLKQLQLQRVAALQRNDEATYARVSEEIEDLLLRWGELRRDVEIYQKQIETDLPKSLRDRAERWDFRKPGLS